MKEPEDNKTRQERRETKRRKKKERIPQHGKGLIVQILNMRGRRASLSDAKRLVAAAARHGKLTEAELADMLLKDGETLLKLKQAAARVKIVRYHG